MADSTYCSTWSGIVYLAFVVDAFSRRIVGWKTSGTMTSLVLDALNMAAWVRRGIDVEGLICHSAAWAVRLRGLRPGAAGRRRGRVDGDGRRLL